MLVAVWTAISRNERSGPRETVAAPPRDRRLTGVRATAWRGRRICKFVSVNPAPRALLDGIASVDILALLLDAALEP